MKIQIKNADKLKKEDYCRILLLSVKLFFIRLSHTAVVRLFYANVVKLSSVNQNSTLFIGITLFFIQGVQKKNAPQYLLNCSG